MKKVLLIVFGILLLAVTACDTGISTPGHGIGREGWWTTPPDGKGDSYECFYWSLSDSTAIWCKEEPVTP